MNKDITLMVLAAGMGSRFGGLKQIEPFGPNGEFIIDYSVYDAIKAGFNKVVFIIKKENYELFKETIGKRIEKYIKVEYAFQEINNIPSGYKLPHDRVKPLGTAQAVLCAKDCVHEPFAMINADDFYGRESFAILADYLSKLDGKQNEYCMVGYRVGNTLSESGSVARGVCEMNDKNELTSVVERTQIERRDGKVMFKEGDVWTEVDENAPVSMNMWGFTPDYFKYSEDYFVQFLKENAENLKAEYFIPLMVNHFIQNKIATVKVLDTPSKWFGVTYALDRPVVVDKINALVAAGEYPAKLF